MGTLRGQRCWICIDHGKEGCVCDINALDHRDINILMRMRMLINIRKAICEYARSQILKYYTEDTDTSLPVTAPPTATATTAAALAAGHNDLNSRPSRLLHTPNHALATSTTTSTVDGPGSTRIG